MKSLVSLGSLVSLSLVSLMAFGQEQSGKISGYMFGDYYYVVANHDSTLENQNGFWFRRIYFTYDKSLSEAFSIRFRLEFNSPGDFRTRARLEPYIKDAYLEWKASRHSILFGVSPTPTWEVIEKVWGYRSVEKTPLDLQKFGDPRDFGVAFKGALDPDKRVNYHFMFSNGAGTSSETDKGKMVLLSVGWNITKNILFEAYADWDDRPERTDRYTLQGFLACQSESFRVGAHFARQRRQLGEGRGNANLEIASAFAAARLSEKAWALARVDRNMDPNPEGNKISYIPFSPDAKSNLIILGIDLQPISDVHIIPNVEMVFYDKKADGKRPDADVIPRLTFYYIWK